MKLFLIRVCYFALGIVCLLALAEVLARWCPNAYRDKDEWMQQHVSQVEVLTLGSSHAYAGIKPEHFAGCAYSLANSNQTQRYDWLLLSRDTMRLTSLRAVVYPVSSLLMDCPMEQTSEWYRCIYYHLYQHTTDHSAWSRYAWEIASMQTCCWKVQSLFISGTADRMCDEHGWCTYYQADDSNLGNLTPEALAKRLQKYEARAVMRTAEEQYFEQIAALCDRQGWRLVLVGMPVSALYRANAMAQRYLDQMAEMAQQAARGHASVEYVDYTDDARFTDADFFDVDHLNERGADKLSQLLAVDCGL